jgi:hypothetical protein
MPVQLLLLLLLPLLLPLLLLLPLRRLRLQLLRPLQVTQHQFRGMLSHVVCGRRWAHEWHNGVVRTTVNLQ